MLRWLGGSKSDHPMHSVKAAEKILSELAPADAEQALDEVCGYLESVAKAADFKPEVRASVLQALDDYGRRYQDSLIEEYLSAARIHDLKSRERCQKAYEFWSALSAAYTECLAKDFPVEKGKRPANEDLIAQLVCRGVRAVAAQERVRHLSYQAVANEVWARGCTLYEIAELLRVDDTGRATNERGRGTECTAWDRITVLSHLKRYWGPDRPSRRTGRSRAQGDLSVLHSLDAIRTVAAQIGTDQLDTIAETAKERKQELRLVPENVDLTPETWTEKDSSESGVGAEVPSQRGRWVKVGRLCAMKGAHFNNWWVGVIRRLDAAGGGARVLAGIQVLTKTPYSLWLKKVGRSEEHTSELQSHS